MCPPAERVRSVPTASPQVGARTAAVRPPISVAYPTHLTLTPQRHVRRVQVPVPTNEGGLHAVAVGSIRRPVQSEQRTSIQRARHRQVVRRGDDGPNEGTLLAIHQRRPAPDRPAEPAIRTSAARRG